MKEKSHELAFIALVQRLERFYDHKKQGHAFNHHLPVESDKICMSYRRGAGVPRT